MMEVENAFNQARKEIAQRFDFKGTSTDLERDKDGPRRREGGLATGAPRRPSACSWRSSRSAACRSRGSIRRRSSRPRAATCRQLVKLKKGLKQEDAKKIVALVKETGLKVQAAIQGEAVRVTGKKRDDLQACMQAIRAASLGVPLQFQNFRE